MQTALLLDSVSSCFEWLVAIVLIAVGALSIRKAEARAGYLVIGTGALWLLSTCCAFIPTLRWQIAPPDEPGILETLVPWLTFFLYAGGLLALAAAAVLLARSITALGGGAR